VSDFLTALISIALVNHLVLTQVLGLDAWFAGAYGLRRSAMFGLCVAFLMIGSTVLTAIMMAIADIDTGEMPGQLLILPFSMVLSCLLLIPVQLALMRFAALDQQVLSRSFPVAALNSAVIGTSLLALWQHNNVIDTAIFAVANAIGFMIFLLIFSAIQQRLNTADVPAPLRGVPILLISAGIMSLAILAFEGVVP
jgi:Na+-translocating ferredoxin:NAD+ oxidoreductase subunit A